MCAVQSPLNSSLHPNTPLQHLFPTLYPLSLNYRHSPSSPRLHSSILRASQQHEVKQLRITRLISQKHPLVRPAQHHKRNLPRLRLELHQANKPLVPGRLRKLYANHRLRGQ